jgi:hypothetical protein
MPVKLTAAAQQKIATLREHLEKVQRVHGLVEQYAVAKTSQDVLSHAVKRAFAQLKRELMGDGFDNMSQLAGSMEIAAGRSIGQQTKMRILRDGVASLRFQIELEQRAIVSAAEQAEARGEE